MKMQPVKSQKKEQNSVLITYYTYMMGSLTTAAYCISKDFFSLRTAILSHREAGQPEPVILSWQTITEQQAVDLLGQEVVTASKNKALGIEKTAEVQ
jgi:hypothetical protein